MLLKRVMFGELVRNTGAAGVQEKSIRGVPLRFRHLDRPVDERISVRGWNPS